VKLASGNTAVAQVPSTLTVPAGATSATFIVKTKHVSATTTVSIFASYAGVTKKAVLAVTR
jgi:hypothetical protein